MLVEELRKPSSPSAKVNTHLAVNAQGAQAALAENRGPLVAQNMLEKGHDRPAAEREIDGLLELLKKLASASLKLTADESRLELAVEVNLSAGK